MEQHSQQPSTDARNTEDTQRSLRSALAEPGSIPTERASVPSQRSSIPTRAQIIAALAEPLRQGWACLHELPEAAADGSSMPIVLCGPGGVIVVETASRRAVQHGHAASGAGCGLAALLPPWMRAAVSGLLVVPGGERETGPEPGVGAPPEKVAAPGGSAVPLDQLGEWIQAHPTMLSPTQISEVIKALRLVSARATATLLTTRDLLRVGDGLPETEISRQRLEDDDTRQRPQAGRPGMGDAERHPSATRSEEVRAAMRTHPSSRSGVAPSQPATGVSAQDIIRVVLMCALVLIGVWFWGVISDVADGTDNNPMGQTSALVERATPSGSGSPDR